MSLKDDMTGAEILADWLGDGEKPVDTMVAEFRSQRCLTCPKNVELGWWDRIKSVLAETVKAEMEFKNDMKMHVAGEDKLGVCSVCRCPLPLKVWTPNVTLKRHVSPEQIALTPDFCWMRKI